MRSFIASLALIFSALPAVSAEPTIHFRTLALPQSKLPELWVMESGKAVPISFSSTQPSAALKANKTNPFKIFTGPLDEKGKPVDTPETTFPVELPATSSILLVGWMKDGKPAFRAVEDSFTTMKNDDWLVVNCSDSTVTFNIGAEDKPVTIEANSQQTFKCTAPAGEGAAATVTSKQADGSWKTVYSNFLAVNQDKRGLVLVVQSGKRINVSYITDPIPQKPASKR